MRLNRLFVPSLLVALLACDDVRQQRAEATPSESPPASVSISARSALNTAEAATLRHMREEEKLAHDVYAALASKSVAFARIQNAERRHFAAIGWQLERYGIADPAAGKASGEFQEPALQKLYTELVERGSRGLNEALAVGLEIEERDIVDLERALGQTSLPELKRVYSNLQRGSRNHLRELDRELTAAGGSYTPKVLDRATFDRIASEPIEPGGMGMGRGQGMGPGGR